jgi:hypothetical protein
MRTPEEYLKQLRDDLEKVDDEKYYSFEEMKKLPEYSLFENIIDQAQKEALEFAASKVYPVSKNEIDVVHTEKIKKEILKGKI